MTGLNELFTDFRKGDEQAYCTIYRFYFQRLCQYGQIFCSDTTLVENTVQDFFLHLLTEGRSLRHAANLEGYFYKSIKQNILKACQLQKRRAVIMKLSGTTGYQHSSPEDILIQQESWNRQISWLKEQIEILPIRQKEMIYLRYYEGFTYDVIAQVTGLSNQIIRNYISRALHKLREKDKLDEV